MMAPAVRTVRLRFVGRFVMLAHGPERRRCGREGGRRGMLRERRSDRFVLRRLLLAFGFARLVARTLVANFGIDTLVNGRASGFELRGVAFNGVRGAAFGCEVLARAAIAASAASATAATASAAFALVACVSGRNVTMASRRFLNSGLKIFSIAAFDLLAL